MQESEVIIINGLPENIYRQIVEKALRYAVLSLPFTFNRMGIEDAAQKIVNIAKGITAEYIFRFFCVKNNLPADFESCTTPFFKPDQRDFVSGNWEWDIKNNFLYYDGSSLPPNQSYTSLPALVPCSYRGDQWDKKEKLMITGSKGVRFLFTFMKNADRERKNSFLQLKLNENQLLLLKVLYRHFEDQRSPEKVFFSEEDFFEEFPLTEEHYHIAHHPQLVITGYAGPEQWPLFREENANGCSYGNGLLKTRIKNRMAVVEQLPSFASLHPQLKEEMSYGVFAKMVSET